jgi:hypothetical protein
MKISVAALVALICILLAGCGSPGAPLPPSLKLPRPVQDLAAVRKGSKVYLTWTQPHLTTDGEAIKRLGETRVCRGVQQLAMVNCAAVAELALPPAPAPQGKEPAPQSSFTDVLPEKLQNQHAAGFASYAIQVENTRERSAGLSNQVEVPLVPTLPPPDDLRAQVNAEGVELTWTGTMHEHPAPEVRHRYRVLRREEGGGNDVAVGEVALQGDPRATLLDRNTEWEKTYLYRATVVSVAPRRAPASAAGQAGAATLEVEGEDSAPVRVVTHDVFPPKAPTGLEAVFSGPGQKPFIDLTWAPNTEPDLAGYNVYRHEQNAQPEKINSALVPTPSFRDENTGLGKRYFYAVTAVDARGNESARSGESSESIPAR